MRESIDIIVNGMRRQCEPHANLAGLLAALGVQDQRIAVEVNEDLVPRSEFAAHRLAAGDRVEIVRAIGGG